MKIGVIGFGAASIGFLSELIDENHEIHILERSKDIFSSSISGIRSDGKIFVSDTMGGDMLRGVDYMGIYSGKTTDKSELFGTFVGESGSVPMIEEAPLNMECKLVTSFEFGGVHVTFVGEVIQTYCAESCLVDGLPDIRKISPVTFSVYDNSYWSIGMHLGKAWNIGIKYTPPREGVE